MTPANLVSYSAQIAILVLACAALPRALGLRSPTLQYAFWRVLLAVCLILPFAEPVRHEQMAFVSSPASPALQGGPAAGAVVGVSVAGPRFGETIAIAAVVLLLLGMAARLAWLSVGVFRLRRLRARAFDRAEGFEDLHRTIGVSPDVYWSADVRHPVAFGIARPIVLLPVALKSADGVAQRAVVAHELHHVRRRDWAWVLCEEIVRSIFWFHPGMWWLVSRVQLARETVVDELSIRTTNARRAYLDTLLAFADDTAAGADAGVLRAAPSVPSRDAVIEGGAHVSAAYCRRIRRSRRRAWRRLVGCRAGVSAGVGARRTRRRAAAVRHPRCGRSTRCRTMEQGERPIAIA